MTNTPKAPTSDVSVEQLEHALKVMAKVVVMFGEDYLPIFMRLQRELEAAREAKMTKLLALEIAKSYNDFD